jgi:zinc resistance-associated protein
LFFSIFTLIDLHWRTLEGSMWKAIVAGIAALAITGTSLVCAQQGGRRDDVQTWQPSAEDLRAFGEARLAALKAGLSLTPEQAKNWPAFEQAARDLGKLRIDRRVALRSAPPSNDPVERLRRRATAMSDTGAALKKLADAAEPLYKSLDEDQRLIGAGRDQFRGRESDGSFRRGPRHTERFGEQRL